MAAPANSPCKGIGRAANVAFTLPVLVAMYVMLTLSATAQSSGAQLHSGVPVDKPPTFEEIRAAQDAAAAPKGFDTFRPQPKPADPLGPMVEERRLVNKLTEESRSARSALKRGDVTQTRLNMFRVGSELPKGHGLFLDDKHRVKLYEDDGWIVMALEKRERAPGGPFEYFNPDTPEDDVAIRFNDEYELLRIGSEVMSPAPPNYIRNPGRRYRITIEGLGVAPYYRSQFEVDAANALDAVETEIHRVAYMGKGMEVPAIEFGGLLAVRAFNESGHLPARIPLTVLRSKVGQIRIQGQYFERGGTNLRLPRFGKDSSGQVFNRITSKQTNPLKQRPGLVHGPTYRRGQGESQFEPLRVQLKPFQPEKSLVPKDIRANQFAAIGSEREAQERFVARIRPLTQPEVKNETALVRADRRTAELLAGSEIQDPLEARASRLDDDGVYSSVSANPGRRSGIKRAGVRRE